jgi:hypothetical protein
MAARAAVEFARTMVRQELQDVTSFIVYPNQSCDGNPLLGDEVVYPQDSLPDGYGQGPWSAADVVGYLWRAGKVPEWIDASVEAENGLFTTVGLRCCGRYTAQDDLLYHRKGGIAPFSVKSPQLPSGWVDAATSGKFDLYWKAHGRGEAKTVR